MQAIGTPTLSHFHHEFSLDQLIIRETTKDSIRRSFPKCFNLDDRYVMMSPKTAYLAGSSIRVLPETGLLSKNCKSSDLLIPSANRCLLSLKETCYVEFARTRKHRRSRFASRFATSPQEL